MKPWFWIILLLSLVVANKVVRIQGEKNGNNRGIKKSNGL